jgi:hypothetical protein
VTCLLFVQLLTQVRVCHLLLLLLLLLLGRYKRLEGGRSGRLEVVRTLLGYDAHSPAARCDDSGGTFSSSQPLFQEHGSSSSSLQRLTQLTSPNSRSYMKLQQQRHRQANK